MSRVQQLRAIRGKLSARPEQTTESTATETGQIKLGLDSERDALLYVPQSYQPSKAMPLAVMLHGSTGEAQQGIRLLQSWADTMSIILLAPTSREYSWDIIAIDRFGPDVVFMDKALTKVFEQYAIDTEHLALGGFSDGASYALSLGLRNGGLFTHILAFSPGFALAGEEQGHPKIYISHGTSDRVLPIDMCSRKVFPQLNQAGYDVQYHEFDGPHTVPRDIAEEAVNWFLR